MSVDEVASSSKALNSPRESTPAGPASVQAEWAIRRGPQTEDCIAYQLVDTAGTGIRAVTIHVLGPRTITEKVDVHGNTAGFTVPAWQPDELLLQPTITVAWFTPDAELHTWTGHLD